MYCNWVRPPMHAGACDQNFHSSQVNIMPQPANHPTDSGLHGLMRARGVAFSQRQCRSTGIDEGKTAASHLSGQDKSYKVFQICLSRSFPKFVFFLGTPPHPLQRTPCIFFPTWREKKLGPVTEGSHQTLRLWGTVSELLFPAFPLRGEHNQCRSGGRGGMANSEKIYSGPLRPPCSKW